MTATVLRVHDLWATYGPEPALRGVGFETRTGERLAVLGPNGGGKSTLFRVLLGDLPPLRGAVEGPTRYASVPQTERSRLDYPADALDVALMGALARLPWWRRPGRAERARALAALGRVGLRERARTRFGELSGGQRQRVLIARALVQDAPVLLLDEPFSGVDVASAEVIERLLDELAAEGRAVLVATHDVEQARRWDRVLCLNGRQIAHGPAATVLTRAVLEETYGAAVVSLPLEGGGTAPGLLPPPTTTTTADVDALAGAVLDPWSEPLLRRSLAELVLLGIAAGAVGCWVIAYRLTYGAESFAHAMLPGLVVAALAGLPLLAGGAAGVAAAAAAVGLAARSPGIERETAIAVTVTALVGLGALLGLAPDVPAAVGDLLFGSPLAVSDADVAVAAALGGAVLAALAVLHHRLLAVGFDAGGARALGLRRAAAEAAVLALLAAVVAVAAGALGNLLVIAAIVGPAATARVLARRMAPMIAAAAAIAAACGFAGLLVSYHAGTAAGASIAAAFVAAHLAALALRRARRPRATR